MKSLFALLFCSSFLFGASWTEVGGGSGGGCNTVKLSTTYEFCQAGSYPTVATEGGLFIVTNPHLVPNTQRTYTKSVCVPGSGCSYPIYYCNKFYQLKLQCN